jgi:diguanylate cyclase (GGDEF)-like protein
MENWSQTTLLSPRTVARLGGLLYIVGAVAMVPLVALGPDAADRRPTLIGVAVAALATGIAAMVLPWDSWPRWATLALAPLAAAVIAFANALSPDPVLYSVFLLLMFAWVGIAHRPGTSARLVLVVMAVYLAPAFFNPVGRLESLRAALVIAPVCVIVGEGLAQVIRRLREAEALNAARLRDLQALVDATIRMARANEPKQTANLVAELAVNLLGANSSLVLLSPSEGGMQPAGSHRWELGVEQAHDLEEGAERALLTGEITRKADGSLAFIPLISSTGPQGLIVLAGVAGHERLLDSFTSGLARTFGTQATVAFERVRATQSLVDQSFKDSLTGVGNRRRADAALELLTTGDAVVIVDLDHFKSVNDTHGHAAGDKVLAELGRLLAKSVRDIDLVARFGGEEFLLILKGVGPKALRAMERLAEYWRQGNPATTWSAGIAVNHAAESPSETLARADAALYEAKAGGRNLVVLSPDPASESSPSLVEA